MALRPLALGVALVLGACIPGAVAPSPSPSPSATVSGVGAPIASGAASDMTAAIAAKPLPTADLFELARRMRGRDGTPRALFEPVRRTPPEEGVGTAREFWIYDFSAKKNVRITASLRLMTDNAKWWVQSDVTVDPAALARSAQVFQDRIYPTDRRLFGEEWTPGIDGDPRIDILIARLPGAAAGYFSAMDEVPLWVNEFSAEREMIYVNAMAGRLGTDNLHSVLAHEFCHMIQFNKRKRSAIWFDEGQAQLCERANGFSLGFERLFLQQPDTQLDSWTDLDEGAAQHYGVAYLFLEYLRARSGNSYGLINALMSQGVDTVGDLDRALRAAGLPGFEEIFADFAAANAFIGAGADAKFGYPPDVVLRDPAKPTTADRAVASTPLRGSVHPEATRYVELPRAPSHVAFSAPPRSRVIATEPHSGSFFWWSDRADGLDSTLTRAVDLGGVRSATLSFWTWFDLEKDFDYGYVAVSTDGGSKWTTLAAPATTTTDLNGNNLGSGFTGRSGGGKEAQWIQQRVDLSPFGGKRVLLRFEEVTDGALNMPGFAVDDIEIPEIGYRDDAEADNGWDAKGFIRSSNVVRERYIVQVLHFGATPSVERWVVENGKLEIDVDPTNDRSAPILAVSALATRVTDPTTFEVLVTSKP
jgi:immune inhibitor A